MYVQGNFLRSYSQNNFLTFLIIIRVSLDYENEIHWNEYNTRLAKEKNNGVSQFFWGSLGKKGVERVTWNQKKVIKILIATLDASLIKIKFKTRLLNFHKGRIFLIAESWIKLLKNSKGSAKSVIFALMNSSKYWKLLPSSPKIFGISRGLR